MDRMDTIGLMTIHLVDGANLEYMLTDAQGSTVAVLNSTGTLLSEQRYLPFGDVRTTWIMPVRPILDIPASGSIGADRAAYVIVLFPVIALLLSTFFEGMTWSPTQFIGVLLILLGNTIVLAKFRRVRAAIDRQSV